MDVFVYNHHLFEEEQNTENINIRQVLIDNRTNVRYNNCIATLGKMLNRNSNKCVWSV